MPARKWMVWLFGVCAVASVCRPELVLGNVAHSPSIAHAQIRIGGRTWKTSSIAIRGNASFLALSAAEQLIKSTGASVSLSDHSLSVQGFPSYTSRARLYADGRKVPSDGTFVLGNSVYADVSVIAKDYHFHLSYDAKAALITLSGQSEQLQKTAPHAITDGGHQPQDKGLGSSVPVQPMLTTSWLSWAGFRPLQMVNYNGVSYVSIYGLIQYFRQAGYSAVWSHRIFSIGALPQVYSDTGVVSGARNDPSQAIRFRGHWFVPLSTLIYTLNMAASVDPLGGVHIQSVSWNGQTSGSAVLPMATTFQVTGTVQGLSPGQVATVAFMNQSGGISTVNTDASGGSFSMALPGSQATLIGIYTPTVGWEGQSEIVRPGDGPLTVGLAQQMGSVQGRVVALGGDTVNGTVELRNDLTHAHYLVQSDVHGVFKTQLPPGPYEVWTVSIGGVTVFSGDRFFVSGGMTSTTTVRVPKLSNTGMVYARHCVVVAQAQDVSPAQLECVANLFERVYQDDIASTGFTPHLPIFIQVYETNSEYTQHFIDEEYLPSEAQSFGTYSQAVSEGAQSVSVNLDQLDYEFAVNVMAHEFTHSLIDTVSQSIPTWVNEGIAWHEGIAAEVGISPVKELAAGLEWAQWSEIVRHQKLGDLFALGHADTLAPRYNVEAQDYFAVELLINQFGMQKVLQYIRQIDTKGSGKAFQGAFGETEASFAAQVTKSLVADANHVDAGFTATVQLQSPDAQMFISNPSGKTFWYAGAAPGIYTFTCLPGGTVIAPKGLHVSAMANSSGDGQWDIGVEKGPSQGFFSISGIYGHYYLSASELFYGTSTTAVDQMASEIPFGLSLVHLVDNHA